MTTKVLIVNFGPDYLLVRTYPKDAEAGENTMCFTGAEFISPSQSKEYYVHSNQGLVIDEDKTGKFAPPNPGPISEHS